MERVVGVTMANPKNYPKKLEDAGFRFVERMSPTSNKLPIRPASSPISVSPSKAMTGSQFSNVIHNVNRAIDIVPSELVDHGKLWYPKAHEIASHISNDDVEKGAGVIAALSSAGGEWGRNVREAEHFMKHGRVPEGSKATADQIAKATRIREGEHYRDVLPKGLKTMNFANLIANPEDETSVVIDTHQADLAGGLKQPWKNVDRGLSSVGRYNTIADALRVVGERRGMRPSEVQAVSWTSWKRTAPFRGTPSTAMIRRGRQA